jgi:hypothetical protein
MNGPEDEGIDEDEGRHAEHDYDHDARGHDDERKDTTSRLVSRNIFRVAFLTALSAQKAIPQYSARHFIYRYH